jgi:ribosome biogenesis protein ENP2
MAMKVATFNNTKVYNLSSGKTLPQWLSESKKRSMMKDDEYRKRLELIQDFEMPTASQCIKMTKDGEHIIVTGTYSPVVKCYNVSDLSMKFLRGLTCEVVAFETLSDDFGKLVFLQTDRTLNFHAPYGQHYSIRVPKFGRDLIYGWEQCDLFVGSSDDEVYRLNLESGQFKEPLKLGFHGCNKVHINPAVPQLLACGGETSAVELWDLRSRTAAAKIRVDPSLDTEVSALKFDSDGLSLGVGTSNGNCILYDIRSSQPLYTKEHQYGLPVIDVFFHNSSKRIISTDKKVVKIWEREEANIGKILTNIETPADINNVHVVEDRRGQSGLLMMTGEQTRVMTYFVPQLGPAPRWCSFLEGLTEELEETAGQNIYEDYKFVTRVEIEELGATSLIGTPMLRGYMHGFFIEMKLYTKLRAVSKPFEYDEHRKKKIRDKIEENRQSRINAKKRLPKVNAALAEKILLNSKNNQNDKKDDKEPIVDSRFASLFKREEFEQDPDSIDFKLRNPVVSNNKRASYDSEDDLGDYNQVNIKGSKLIGQGDDASDEDYDDDYGDDYNNNNNEIGFDANDGWDSDLDEITAEPIDRRNKNSMNNLKRSKYGRDDDEGEEDGQIAKETKKILERNNKLKEIGEKIANKQRKRMGMETKEVRMYELNDSISSSKAVFNQTDEEKHNRLKSKKIQSIPINERLKLNSGKSENQIRKLRNNKDGVTHEISYIPNENKSEKNDSNRRDSNNISSSKSSGRGGSGGSTGRSSSGRGRGR